MLLPNGVEVTHEDESVIGDRRDSVVLLCVPSLGHDDHANGRYGQLQLRARAGSESLDRLDSIVIWNFNAVYYGGSETDRGVQQFDLTAASNPGLTGNLWTSNDLVINQAAGVAGGGVEELGQVVGMAGASGVRYVRLDVDTNYGGDVVGLSEVRFLGQLAPVPEPSTLALLLVGLAGILAVDRDLDGVRDR